MSDREALGKALITPLSKAREADWATILDAARERLAQLPEKCERCKGTGEFRYLDSSGSISSDMYPCPTCHGYGKVFPSETVEKVSHLIASMLMSDRQGMQAGAFVALCNAHAFAILVALNGQL